MVRPVRKNMERDETMIQILKVREKQETVVIHCVVDGFYCSFTAPQEPAKAFVNALAGLKSVVAGILGFSEKWMENVSVKGLTLTPVGEDNFKVTLVARKDMAHGSPFNIAVPYRFLKPKESEGEEDAADSSSEVTLTEPQAALVTKLCREAVKYIQSMKPVGQMFLSFGGGGVQEAETVPEGTTPFPQPEAPQKRKRGRPRKNPVPAEEADAGVAPDAESEAVAAAAR